MNETTKSLTPDQIQIRLVEYQKAQDSGEHHANMSWTTTSLIWTASLVLMGFVLNNLDSDSLTIPLVAVSLLGVFLVIMVNLMDARLDTVVHAKFKRCKLIESELGMNHHIQHTSNGLKFRVYYNIVTGLMLIVWIIILFTILHPLFCGC